MLGCCEILQRGGPRVELAYPLVMIHGEVELYDYQISEVDEIQELGLEALGLAAELLNCLSGIT